MPAPSRTDRDRIVATATALLEEGGTEAVTMQAVAQRVGVQAPSLYKHVRHRRALLEAVVGAAVDDLNARLEVARDDRDPRRAITTTLDEVRRFAHERPRAYALVMGATPELPRPTPELLGALLSSILTATGALAGDAHALDGARLVVAWANGFVSMELAGALQLGGDIDAAWTWGLQRVVAALSPGTEGRLTPSV